MPQLLNFLRRHGDKVRHLAGIITFIGALIELLPDIIRHATADDETDAPPAPKKPRKRRDCGRGQ